MSDQDTTENEAIEPDALDAAAASNAPIVSLIVSFVAVVVGFVAPRLVPDALPFPLIGQAASALLVLPAALFLLSAGTLPALTFGGLRYPALGRAAVRRLGELISATFGFGGRVAVVGVGFAVLADPVSAPSRLLAGVGAFVHSLTVGVASIVAVGATGGATLLVVIVLLWMFLGTPAASSKAAPAASAGAGALATVLRFVARAVGTLAVRSAAGVIALATGLVIWLLAGQTGLGVLLGDGDRTSMAAPVRALAALTDHLAGVVTGGASLRGLVPFGGKSTTSTDSFYNVAHVSRRLGGKPSLHAWDPGRSAEPELARMATFGNRLLSALDYFMVNSLKADSLPAYTIRIRRAALEPGRFLFSLHFEPIEALFSYRSIAKAQLVLLLSSQTGLSQKQVESRLDLDPEWVSEDPDHAGLFVAFNFADAAADGSAPRLSRSELLALANNQKTVMAVMAGLQERGLPIDHFRLVSGPSLDWHETGAGLTYGARYDFSTGSNSEGSDEAYAANTKLWGALAQSVANHGLVAANHISMWTAPSPKAGAHRYVVLVALPNAIPAVPGDVPGDSRTQLAPLMTNGLAERGKRQALKFTEVVIGIDRSGKQVILDLAEAPHCLVVGATKSGKSFSGIISPLLQLAAKASPKEVQFWLVDPKQELDRFVGQLRHTHRLSHAATAEGAIQDVLDPVRAECQRRRDAYAGEDWTPAFGAKVGDPFLVVVIEELQAVIAGSIADGDKAGAERLEAAINQMGAMARSVGCSIFVASQRGTSDILKPGILQNLTTRIVGRVGEPEMRVLLGSAVDVVAAAVPRGKPGRLAVTGPGIVGLEDDVTLCHGLWSSQEGKPPADVKRVMDLIVAADGGPRTERKSASFWSPKPTATAAPDDADEFDEFGDEDGGDAFEAMANSADAALREPTKRELDNLSTASLVDQELAYARMAYLERGDDDAPVAASLNVAEGWIKARRDGQAVRRAVTADALAGLERLGVLVAGVAGGRLLGELPWPIAYERIVAQSAEVAPDADESEDDFAPDLMVEDEPVEDDGEDMPRRPTQAEVDDFAPLTAARAVFLLQEDPGYQRRDADGMASFDTMELTAYLANGLGYSRPAPEAANAALRALAGADVLERLPRQAAETQRYQKAMLGWSVAHARLTRAA